MQVFKGVISMLAGALALTLAAGTAPADPKTITVGWQYEDPLQPLAAKLLENYSEKAGKPVPELVFSNQNGSRPQMKGPDGRPTLGYLVLDPVNGDHDGLISVPVASRGYVLYANEKNPFLEKLCDREISGDDFRKIWFGGITWEELTGEAAPGKGKTPVKAFAPDAAFLALIGGPGVKSAIPIAGGPDGVRRIHADRFAIGALPTDTLYYETLKHNRRLPGSVMPLVYRVLPNGNRRLEPFGTSGGRGDMVHADIFGEVLVNGDFLRRNVVFRTQTAEGRELGEELARAANRLGREGLYPFACHPLKLECTPKTAPSKKFVYTHAMACFLIGGIPNGFANSYASDAKVGDYRAWPPAIGPGTRSWWSERLTPRVHEMSVEAAKLDLDCAARAGVDGFGILLTPGELSPDNPWHRGIMNLIEAARTHKVKIVFDLWSTSKQGWSREQNDRYLGAYGRKIREIMEKYPESFLKIDGKPALAFGRDMIQPPRRDSDYDVFFRELGGREKYYLIMTLNDTRRHNVYTGFEKLGDITSMWYVNSGWGDKVLDYALLPLRERNDALCWGVTPGYYRANYGGRVNGGNVQEGFGACLLTDSWRDAIRHGAGGVYLQSWNDMGEDHHMLESNYRGDTFIRLCGYFSEWFHTGKKPEIDREQIFIFHRRQLKDAKLTAQTGRKSENPSWSSAPLTDYVHVVTMLKRPGDVKVKLGTPEFELKNVPAGLHEWLLLVPVRKDHTGNRPYWNRGAYETTRPFDTEFRKVTELREIAPCMPEAAVVRDGKTVLKVVSRTGLDGTARFQDLSVTGNVSEAAK